MQESSNSTGKAQDVIFLGAEWRKTNENAEAVIDSAKGPNAGKPAPVDGAKRGFPGFFNSKKAGEAPN